VKLELEASRGQGIKLQHFAAVFENRAERSQREILLFIYRTGSGRGMQVTEIPL
jgi:anaerobic magnesium-protoporphyrin IX monomethyl ester cyclase